MKKITAILFSLSLLVSAVSCSQTNSTTSEVSTESTVTQELSAPTSLTNHMTDKERSKVTVGDLTVFDHMQKETEELIPTDGVYLEIWTGEDELDYWEHYREHEPDDTYVTDEMLEKNMEYFRANRDSKGKIYTAYVDGMNVMTGGLEPDIDYDGGELTVDKELPAWGVFDENGNFSYTDKDGNEITEEKYNELTDEYYASDHTVTFADFEEFKPYLRERIEALLKTNDIPSSFVDRFYEENLKMWEAVIDRSYKTLPVGTTERLAAEEEAKSVNTWEIDREKVEEIAPYVREYNIYDEQLDANFVVHVTLPPNYSGDKTYPAYVLTDGVWRFNNCADLRKAMEEGRASNVILVSIGYDYSIDGTNDDYRIKYFCDKCEDFLNFITDDLMPYLGEEYNIDNSRSIIYGHSLGGTFAHYAAFNSDKYENQPFKNYIIGSPAFWSPGFLPYADLDVVKNEYGYFDRNDSFDKNVFVCGGADEDPVYEEYYGENDSTLEGIQHLMERLEGHGVTTAESKIYPDSEHYQFIPEMLVEILEKYYPM
ncbi:MAG: alpha/beta hydrolase [Ruminococcus sp.]|nr:alpha/beta hydrolase [Ruminococcus sp.]